MTNIFLEAFNAVSGNDFAEKPVELEYFVEHMLHHPPLSRNQYQVIKASTQIYKKETLIDLYGVEDGTKRYSQTYNEIIVAWGKGSGKDMVSRISCAYVIYLLLCLKNPQAYYGKPNDDAIDVMNIAINADQANRVFFKGFVKLIKNCEWFDGKFEDKRGEINFDKNINLISGHSESESLEGFNVIFVVLDEISGFALESATGNVKAKTAQAIYDMHRGSVDSRFPSEGKLVLLSFPRFKGDFISQRYDDVVAEKETTIKTHTFKRDPDLPDGIEGNEFTIEWEEDHILRYKYPRMFAQKRPTWQVNPTKHINDFTRAFDANPADALARFAAQPTDGGDDAFFKNKDAIDNAMVATNAVDKHGVFLDGWKPKKETKYFMHVDLAQKHDRCVVAMAHVEKWVEVNVGSNFKEIHPIVVVDAVRWWQPTKEKSVDFKDVTDYILAVRRRGFDLKLITFDRWNSNDTRNFLESQGIKTDNLSVGNDHYSDYLGIMYDQRLIGPKIPELIQELKELRWIKGKVDHPRSGYNDLSDGTCGAIYNAIKHTSKPRTRVVEVHSLKEMYKQERNERMNQAEKDRNVIKPPREMPHDVKEWLGRIL